MVTADDTQTNVIIINNPQPPSFPEPITMFFLKLELVGIVDGGENSAAKRLVNIYHLKGRIAYWLCLSYVAICQLDAKGRKCSMC